MILNHFQTSTTSTPKGGMAALGSRPPSPLGQRFMEKKKTMKDDRFRLRVFKASDEFHLMLVHSDGEDLGAWSGPYETEQQVTMAATQQAEQEGFVFP